MDLQITGKITQILPEQSGESRNGPWRKQEFIMETEGKYPKQICVVQWGENIDQFEIREGETIDAHIDLQSREHNGRWYTDVKVWRVERPKAGQSEEGTPPAVTGEPWPDSAPMEDGEDDLPF